MRFSDVEPAYQAFTRDLVGRFGFDPAEVLLDMAPGDEMFFKGILPGYQGRPGGAVYRYVESALRTYEAYRQLAEHLGGFANLGRVLDFGSGYGRLTRLLVNRLDRSQLWVSDIYPDAVAWQTATFGVNGVVSAPDPADFVLAGEYAIVFAASVFSHFPNGLFQRWLARLYRNVAPGGLLAFSTHGVALAQAGQAIGPDGIGYATWSESDTLDPAIYGMSYVTEAFVRGAVRDACGEAAAASLRLFPRALFENQDLWVVGGPEQPLEGLQVRAAPMGGLNGFGVPGRPWTGWGVEPNPGHQIVRAELFLDGSPVAVAKPIADNFAVLRFFPGAPNTPVRWAFDAPSGAAARLARIELTSDTGCKAYAYGLEGADTETAFRT